MRQIWKPFRALYFASLMMLIGSGLLSTYLALRLAADHVDSLWVGALMAANYFGLVLGGKIGHRLIGRVGHIRAYATCAGIVGAAVLGHGLINWLPAWIVLRMIVGLGMMCQYMVIESWLNEQAEAKQRGAVFSGYMIASYLGLVLGQLILVMHPQLGLELLMLVALCFALCLVPVAMTRRIHPAPLHPAPMEPRFFIKRVPQSLSTVLGAGLIVGSFYGLAPLYASQQGLTTEQVGLFMGSCIFAGLLVQWPLGWLSDRYDRALLIRCFALCLATVIERDHFDPNGLQATGHLLARDRRVVHRQHPQRDRLVRGFGVYHTHRYRLGGRGHFGEDFLHVDDFHQLVVDPRHRREVVIATGALGRRMDLFPVHVDDALHRAHQETLGLGVVLGNDHEWALAVLQPRRTGGHCQVKNRDGRATNVRHTANHRAGLGHYCQLGTLQHFANLEDINPVQLLAVQTEQQQLQAILPHQLCALVH